VGAFAYVILKLPDLLYELRKFPDARPEQFDHK